MFLLKSSTKITEWQKNTVSKYDEFMYVNITIMESCQI